MENLLLKVKDLTVNIGNEQVINKMSFSVKERDFLVLLGPNGAGKTTLLRALLGLIPFEGQVEWQKKVKISYLPERLAREKFQEMNISVKDLFFLREPSKEKILNLLKEVGLDPKEVLEKNPGYLSSGEFQRVLFAWTLISEPEVLFLDEPATGIDIGGEETVFELLESFWKSKNLTVILVTHDLEIVYRYATTVLCVGHKTNLCFGKPIEILTPEVLEELYGTKIKFYSHYNFN